ncbi:hypothetical protein [Paludibacterium paludis]|uniref:hypothetical protein n=1 Tax=Paludibacterium paludis TaxID=1225769 RepID=UPI001672D29C|nr:hypothetical protein [Paludibacterium paludis]
MTHGEFVRKIRFYGFRFYQRHGLCAVMLQLVLAIVIGVLAALVVQANFALSRINNNRIDDPRSGLRFDAALAAPRLPVHSLHSFSDFHDFLQAGECSIALTAKPFLTACLEWLNNEGQMHSVTRFGRTRG